MSERYSYLTESSDFSCDDESSNQHVTSTSSLVFLETENKDQETGIVRNKDKIPDKNLTQSCSEISCLNANNNKNKFVISLRSKVLALYDESNNIWKEGIITKIKDSSNVYDLIEISFNQDNQENLRHILFCVKFDLEIENNNENLEKVELNFDLSPMSSQSSADNWDLAVNKTNKKRKVSLEKNVESAVKRKKILETTSKGKLIYYSLSFLFRRLY